MEIRTTTQGQGPFRQNNNWEEDCRPMEKTCFVIAPASAKSIPYIKTRLLNATSQPG